MILFNKKDCCYNIAGLVFMPGINEVQDSSFNHLKEHDLVKSLIKNGVFKVIKEKEVEEAKEEIIREINPRATDSQKETMRKDLKVQKTKGSLNLKSMKKKESKKEAK